MKRFSQIRPLAASALFFAAMIVSNRGAWFCFFLPGNAPERCVYGDNSSDFALWGLIAMAVLLLVLQRNLLREYLASWKANWPMMTFIGYSLISLSWSIHPDQSIHSFFIMLAVSLAVAGFAVLFSWEQLFSMLLWFLGMVAVGSLLVIIYLPLAGIHQEPWWAGNWRGLFWHKNWLGSIMALGNALALLAVWRNAGRGRSILPAAGLLLLTLLLVVMSRAVTGWILVIVLDGLIVLNLAWSRGGRRLSRRSLIGAGGALSVLGAAALIELGPILSLFGKDTSLTGRIPLWSYLVEKLVIHRPWFGYGLETIWNDPAFQDQTGRTMGWGMKIMYSHNGLLDMLIYLGIFGLVLFLVVVLVGLARAVRLTFTAPGPLTMFAPVLLGYVVLTNMTNSLFLEFENFHWVLFSLALFASGSVLQRGGNAGLP
jgi:O-antigen ligase